jgi:hypothetical protein
MAAGPADYESGRRSSVVERIREVRRVHLAGIDTAAVHELDEWLPATS